MGVLIIGCGYLGARVAGHYLATGIDIDGVVRSAASAAQLKAEGVGALRLDLDRPLLAELPLRGSQLFYFAPPPREGVKDSRVAHLTAAFHSQGQPRRLVYISTSGVYGDCGGAWVNELRPVAPAADRARRRWDAEQQFRAWHNDTGGELVVLRVAGIYGPGRLPLDRLRRELPLVREEEAPWTNRIHIDDLVQVCIAAMERGRNGEVYNVCDGHPSSMTDYFNRVADQAGLPRPPLITLAQADQQLSAGMLGYMHESRRLDNSKMLQELDVTLRHPDLASGLPGCFTQGSE